MDHTVRGGVGEEAEKKQLIWLGVRMQSDWYADLKFGWNADWLYWQLSDGWLQCWLTMQSKYAVSSWCQNHRNTTIVPDGGECSIWSLTHQMWYSSRNIVPKWHPQQWSSAGRRGFGLWELVISQSSLTWDADKPEAVATGMQTQTCVEEQCLNVSLDNCSCKNGKFADTVAIIRHSSMKLSLSTFYFSSSTWSPNEALTWTSLW